MKPLSSTDKVGRYALSRKPLYIYGFEVYMELFIWTSLYEAVGQLVGIIGKSPVWIKLNGMKLVCYNKISKLRLAAWSEMGTTKILSNYVSGI